MVLPFKNFYVCEKFLNFSLYILKIDFFNLLITRCVSTFIYYLIIGRENEKTKLEMIIIFLNTLYSSFNFF